MLTVGCRLQHADSWVQTAACMSTVTVGCRLRARDSGLNLDPKSEVGLWLGVWSLGVGSGLDRVVETSAQSGTRTVRVRVRARVRRDLLTC